MCGMRKVFGNLRFNFGGVAPLQVNFYVFYWEIGFDRGQKPIKITLMEDNNVR
jgi:hypothetical protein